MSFSVHSEPYWQNPELRQPVNPNLGLAEALSPSCDDALSIFSSHNGGVEAVSKLPADKCARADQSFVNNASNAV